MKKHLKLLSVLYIVFGSLQVISGLVAWAVLHDAGFMSGATPGAFLSAAAVGTVLAVFLTAVSIASVIGAVGLLNRRRWARIVLLVLSFLILVHFPLGTALGIYGIWVLMKDETDILFARDEASVAQHGSVSGR